MVKEPKQIFMELVNLYERESRDFHSDNPVKFLDEIRGSLLVDLQGELIKEYPQSKEKLEEVV